MPRAEAAVRGGRFAPSLPVVAAIAAGLAVTAATLAASQDWTVDGAALAYTSSASGNSELMLRVGAAAPVNLTRNGAQDHKASWSPDGERIAFQRLRDGNREIYVMNADGSDPVNLTNDPAQDLLPGFSPDGRQILFFSDRGIEHGPRELPGNLYVMNADGTGIKRLTSEPMSANFAGGWSPDGTAVVFARDFEGDIDLVLLDVESARETRLHGTADAESGGAFSPDGRLLSFHAVSESGEARIVVSAIDGTSRREITSGAQHYNPRWSPDGRWIVFTGAPLGANRYDVIAVDVNTGEVRPLVATDADERAGVWRPPAR